MIFVGPSRTAKITLITDTSLAGAAEAERLGGGLPSKEDSVGVPWDPGVRWDPGPFRRSLGCKCLAGFRVVASSCGLRASGGVVFLW